MVATSFSCKVEEVSEWHERVGKANVRVAKIENRPAASLVTIRMGMWFGGNSVPALGVQGVATSSEFRGRGLRGLPRSLYSMGGEARWHCGPWDPLLGLLPERGFTLKREEDWMLRIINLESALCARG